MRVAVITILLLTAMYPLVTSTSLEDNSFEPQFTGASGVEIISESEPNNVNTSGQDVYPGDVVRGSVDMWDDKHDWFNVWLEPGQTLLLTLSHASGDGVSMSVYHFSIFDQFLRNRFDFHLLYFCNFFFFLDFFRNFSLLGFKFLIYLFSYFLCLCL